MGGGSSKKKAEQDFKPTKKDHRQKPSPRGVTSDGPVPLNYTLDVRIKCKYKNNVRVVHSSFVPTFRGLQKRLAGDYGFDVQLTYEDDDGDNITLMTQNDLDQLYDYCRRHKLDKVTVYVTPAPASDHLSALPGAPIYEQRPDPAALPLPMRNERIRWRRGEMLGEGAFGKVFLALHLDNGGLMAVKQIFIKQGTDKEVGALMSEIDLMKNLCNPHIVQYLGTEKHNNTLSIFLEYVPGGSIASLLAKFGAFDTLLVQTYTRQILLGLDHLHQNDIAHRDIKGANILIDNNGVVKLSDFGGSINLADVEANEGGMQSAKGTAYWMAPEVIRQKASKAQWKKADIWSVACTVVEMATGKPPWSNYSNPVTALYQIACRRAPPPMPEDMDELGKKFLELCFKTAPDERSSTDELLLHYFVRDTNMNRTAEFSNYGYGNGYSNSAGGGGSGDYSEAPQIETSLPGSTVKESMASPASIPSPTGRGAFFRRAAGNTNGSDSDFGGGGGGGGGSSWLSGRGRVRRGGGDERPTTGNGTTVNLRELVKQGRGGGASSQEEEEGSSDQGYTTAEYNQSDYDSERETDFSTITNAIDFDPMSLIDHNYSKDVTNYGVATQDLQMSYQSNGGFNGIASSNFRLQIATRRKGRKQKRDIERAERRAQSKGGFGQGKDKQIRKLQNNMKKLQEDRLKNRSKEEAASKIQAIFRQYRARNPTPSRLSFKVNKRVVSNGGYHRTSSPRGNGYDFNSGAARASTAPTNKGIRPRGKVILSYKTGSTNSISGSGGGSGGGGCGAYDEPDTPSKREHRRGYGGIGTSGGDGGASCSSSFRGSGVMTRPPTYSSERNRSHQRRHWEDSDDEEEDDQAGYLQAERELILERQRAADRLRAQQMQAMEAGR